MPTMPSRESGGQPLLRTVRCPTGEQPRVSPSAGGRLEIVEPRPAREARARWRGARGGVVYTGRAGRTVLATPQVRASRPAIDVDRPRTRHRCIRTPLGSEPRRGPDPGVGRRKPGPGLGLASGPLDNHHGTYS